MAALLLIGVAALVLLLPTSRTTPPRMAGSPLVTARNENASVLILTSHQETRSSLLIPTALKSDSLGIPKLVWMWVDVSYGRFAGAGSCVLFW